MRTYLRRPPARRTRRGSTRRFTGTGGATDTLNKAIASDLKNLKAGPGYASTIAGQVATLQTTLTALTPPADNKFFDHPRL